MIICKYIHTSRSRGPRIFRAPQRTRTTVRRGRKVNDEALGPLSRRMQRATYRSFLPFMHASYCRRCTGTMSGDDDLSTHYALAKLLSCPRRNSAPHLARFTATLAAHLARVTAILAALASPLTSILTPFHASGLRLRVRDHQHGRERGYCSRQAQRRKKLPSRDHDCLRCWTAPRFKKFTRSARPRLDLCHWTVALTSAILRRSPPAVADITSSPRHGASHQRGGVRC